MGMVLCFFVFTSAIFMSLCGSGYALKQTAEGITIGINEQGRTMMEYKGSRMYLDIGGFDSLTYMRNRTKSTDETSQIWREFNYSSSTMNRLLEEYIDISKRSGELSDGGTAFAEGYVYISYKIKRKDYTEGVSQDEDFVFTLYFGDKAFDPSKTTITGKCKSRHYPCPEKKTEGARGICLKFDKDKNMCNLIDLKTNMAIKNSSFAPSKDDVTKTMYLNDNWRIHFGDAEATSIQLQSDKEIVSKPKVTFNKSTGQFKAEFAVKLYHNAYISVFVSPDGAQGKPETSGVNHVTSSTCLFLVVALITSLMI